MKGNNPELKQLQHTEKEFNRIAHEVSHFTDGLRKAGERYQAELEFHPNKQLICSHYHDVAKNVQSMLDDELNNQACDHENFLDKKKIHEENLHMTKIMNQCKNTDQTKVWMPDKMDNMFIRDVLAPYKGKKEAGH